MLGQRLRQLRKEKSLTIQQVADKLGVTRACVFKKETGTSRSDFNRLESLANVFGLSARDLLDNSPGPAAPHQVSDASSALLWSRRSSWGRSQKHPSQGLTRVVCQISRGSSLRPYATASVPRAANCSWYTIPQGPHHSMPWALTAKAADSTRMKSSQGLTSKSPNGWDRQIPTMSASNSARFEGGSSAWITYPRGMLRLKAMVQCALITFGLGDLVTPRTAPGTRRGPSTVRDLRQTLGA